MNYLIMSRDITVAKWIDNELIIANDSLLPLYLKRVHNANTWLETRAIDSHRANSRLLKKALHLKEKDDISTVLHVNAATITDTYWIKPLDSALTYADIKFNNDYFSNLALHGTYDSFNRAANSTHSRTPELTNTGSFEKCWKLRGGAWWMYKRATHNEQFSELFVYELGQVLGMNMAEYKRGDGCVKTKDFTNGASVNFEPASAFMGGNEDYIAVMGALETLCPNAISDYVKMIFLDTIVANPDRHTNNFGLLRDVKTGQLLRLTPNYDNNMALIARGYPKNMTPHNDMLIKLFNELLAEYPKHKKYIPAITEQTIHSVLNKLNMKVKTQFIVEYVMGRYREVCI
jgi:hypothetical protein